MFPVRTEFNFIFNTDIVNTLFKINGGEAESLILLFLWFKVLYISVGGWKCRKAQSLD